MNIEQVKFLSRLHQVSREQKITLLEAYRCLEKTDKTSLWKEDSENNYECNDCSNRSKYYSIVNDYRRSCEECFDLVDEDEDVTDQINDLIKLYDENNKPQKGVMKILSDLTFPF